MNTEFHSLWRASANEAVMYSNDYPEALLVLPELIDGALGDGKASEISIEIDMNGEKSVLRVKDNGDKWRYLSVLNDNSEIQPGSVLDDYPSGTNRFTITNTDTGNTIDFNSIKQTVTIKGSNGLYLCLGRKYTRYLYGRFAMRFLNVGKEYDWKFLLYIEHSLLN